MNTLKQMTKNNRLAFAVVAVLLLLFVSLQGQITQLYAADAQPTQKEVAAYPATPEGVVEAFVRAGLRDVLISVEEMRLCDEILQGQSKYFPDKEDEKINRKTRVMDASEPWGHSLDKFHIAAGYEIKEVRKGKNKASVKVLYKRLGWIWHMPMHIKECRSRTAKDKHEKETLLETAIKLNYKKKGWVWDKEGCQFLHITNDTLEVTYDLAKPGMVWRIIYSYEPNISVNSAIKVLKCLIIEKPKVVRTYPSEKQEIEIKEAIETLEKHLKNDSKRR